MGIPVKGRHTLRHRVSRKLLRPLNPQTNAHSLQQQLDAKPRLSRSNAFRLDRSNEYKDETKENKTAHSTNDDSRVDKKRPAGLSSFSRKQKKKKKNKKKVKTTQQ